ncbi:MAG: hypothetical protein HAW67_05175 [Endozoicomonadaceae bacterium]|nr:hypothetical protein [Endozoicomonadaceae bacterium]
MEDKIIETKLYVCKGEKYLGADNKLVEEKDVKLFSSFFTFHDAFNKARSGKNAIKNLTPMRRDTYESGKIIDSLMIGA